MVQYWNGIGKLLVCYRYDIAMVLIMSWNGMVLQVLLRRWCCYATGMTLVWCFVGIGMLLVWYCCSSSMSWYCLVFG